MSDKNNKLHIQKCEDWNTVIKVNKMQNKNEFPFLYVQRYIKGPQIIKVDQANLENNK